MRSKLGWGLMVAALALWTTGCDDTADPFIADASPGAGGQGGGAGGMGGGAGGEGGGAGGMGGGAGGMGGGAGGMGGGAGGAGGGAGGMGGGMGGMGGTPPLEGCDLYCSLMADNCPDAFADAAACQEACGTYGSDGEEGDTEGDTLQCRIYHAGVAADDAALHCPHAGPDGGGVCSEPCNDYCADMMANCPDAYPDEAACVATCALFPTEGARGDTDGNSVHCRAYHAGAAADDAALHCPHASSNGGGVCGDYCENYCGIIMQTCEGSYADMDDCMANCAALPADGEWSAVDGDSVQCRTYHASFPALGDSDLHCPHAGADGGSVCGSYCEVYCNRVGENCPGLYADEAECMSFCDVIPDDGDNGATDGNSLQCRIYHATLPAQMDGALHCPHASVSGGGTCGDWCDVYCDLQAETCTGDNAVFQDRDSCLATCAAYPQDGAYDATDGNSVQCRIYHSSVPAAADPVTHCPHTSQAGGGVCGSACEGYCSQVMANCDSVYDSMEQCMTVCAALPDGGEWNAVEGNSVQCRAYHASFPAVGDAVTHCPHAGVLGGEVCGPTTSSQRCRFYCDLVEGRDDGSVEGACGDLYEDEFDCGVQCAEFDRAEYDSQVGDNYECRLYAAAQAVSSPEMWCAAASMDGGDVCTQEAIDPCNDYCDLMLANCPGYYPDAAACAAACGLFPTDGTEGDTEGNTVQCRTYHAGVAADDAALHCPHASSNGGGVCGEQCENFCSIVMQTCPDTYADNDTCLAECALFPADGAPDAVDGDSVQCRTYHASFPAQLDPELHCLHTTPAGGDFCGGYCDVYCNRMEANCPESYADRGACMNACAGFPTDGVPGALDGNSVQCRIYHASVPATMDAMLHCPHAGQGGGGVCGSYCENYCELTQANCTEANQIYPAMDACLAACEAMPQDGAMGTTEGNSIQCRTYHATVAGDDPALHCQHAGITGGGVCGANACESYCDQVTYNCTGDNAQYPSREACLGGCVELNREGEWNATEGNSVQCRAYHASFPAAADPMTHCPHAGAVPTDFCVDPQ